MEDPFSTHTDQEDTKSDGIPTWVWGVGGLVFGSSCCLALIVGTLVFAQPQLETFMDEVSVALEERTEQTAATRVTPIEGETTEREEVSSENNTVFNRVESLLQSDESVTTRQETERPSDEPYAATFDEQLGWATGEVMSNDGSDRVQAEVSIVEGALQFTVFDDNGLYWATAGELFSNGRYQVEATAVAGPVDNGFGMMFMVDDAADDFYMFEVSSDGYVWIGYYDNGGELIEPLNGEGWFASDAVNQGLGAVNVLTVTANAGNMIFFVNDQEVAQVRDFKLLEGDVGVFVETLGEGNAILSFDDFTFQP